MLDFSGNESSSDLAMKVVTKSTEVHVAPMKTKPLKEIGMAEPMIMMPLKNVRRTNQEVPLIVTQALQRKHRTVAVQRTLAPLEHIQMRSLL